MYNEPFAARMPMLTPLTGPDALPNDTINPNFDSESSEPMNVSLPTPS